MLAVRACDRYGNRGGARVAGGATAIAVALIVAGPTAIAVATATVAYGYGGAAVGAAAVGAAAVAAHHCWINSYGHRECNYNYY